MSSVCSTSHLSSSIHLDMLDDKGIDIQTLQVSIALSVLEHLKQKVCTLLWPSTLSSVELLGLCTSSRSIVKTTEWNTTLFVDNILQVLGSTTDVKTFNSLSCLTGVLEVDTKIGSPSLTRLCGILGLSRISSHLAKEMLPREGLPRKGLENP